MEVFVFTAQGLTLFHFLLDRLYQVHLHLVLRGQVSHLVIRALLVVVAVLIVHVVVIAALGLVGARLGFLVGRLDLLVFFLRLFGLVL